LRKERAELRRGLRALIQRTSEELKDLTRPGIVAPGGGIHPVERAEGEGWKSTEAGVDERAGGEEQRGGGLRFVTQSRHGVCWAYYVNPQCWEIPEAYCNQALHICMLRNCPVYRLHREEMERRFAEKFRYLW
jgi:hypothetical protein